MSDPKLPDQGGGGASATERTKGRRSRVLLAVGGFVLLATIVALVLALVDDARDARVTEADRTQAVAPAPARSVPPVPPAARPPTRHTALAGGANAVGTTGAAVGAVTGTGGVPGVASAATGSATSAAAGLATGHHDAGADVAPPSHPDAAPPRVAAPSTTKALLHPVKATAPHPDGGAGGRDAGAVRPREGEESTRRPPRESRGRDERDEDGDFVLVSRFVPNGGSVLQGKVLDGDSGHAVAGAVIEARHAGKYMKATTDANGSYRMVGMIPGSRVVVWIGGRRDPFVAERVDILIPGEGLVADAGAIRLLRGDEMGPRLTGWVGLFVSRRGGRVIVSAVSPWLPADRAGVQVGDGVVSVDGHDLAGFGPRAATYLLRGPPGSSAAVVLDSAGGKRKLALERVQR